MLDRVLPRGLLEIELYVRDIDNWLPDASSDLLADWILEDCNDTNLTGTQTISCLYAHLQLTAYASTCPMIASSSLLLDAQSSNVKLSFPAPCGELYQQTTGSEEDRLQLFCNPAWLLPWHAKSPLFA